MILKQRKNKRCEVKYKRSMLGNMKFVGELLCKKMLSSKIIFQCVEELLDVKNDEAIETLAVRAFHLSWLDAPARLVRIG